VEAKTLNLLLESDLATVSSDRIDAELDRLAAEPEPGRALGLLAGWGLVAVAPAEIDAFATAARLTADPRWRGSADLGRLLVETLRGDLGSRAADLAVQTPESASAAVELARGCSGEQLLLARAFGAEWLDRYVDEWHRVRLEISGEDLLAAGIAQGPAVGRGLAAALRAKLDDRASSREDELRIALEEARA
jgi:tRNA nucleotidyltransferase (CCA-adding enzyme)